MSIGNLKDTNNLGNNFPFQLKVLQGLQAVVDGNCCREIVDLLTIIEFNLRSTEKRPGVISTSTTGSTIPGWYSFSIANVGSAAGTVGGASIPAGTTLNFDGGVLNNTLATLAYDATGTTFLISYIG